MIKYAGQVYRTGDDDASLRLRQRPHVVNLGGTVHESPHHPQPRIDHGRWLVDCPECHSGAGVSTTGNAYCFECGAIMTVTLPPLDVRQAAETELLARPEPNRNWRPDRESIADLKTDRRPDGPA